MKRTRRVVTYGQAVLFPLCVTVPTLVEEGPEGERLASGPVQVTPLHHPLYAPFYVGLLYGGVYILWTAIIIHRIINVQIL